MSDPSQQTGHGRGPDLLDAAIEACRHSGLMLDEVVSRVALPTFRPPTDYQVFVTAQVARAYAADLARRFLQSAAQEEPACAGLPVGVAFAEGDPELIAAALARADEHWVAEALRSPTAATAFEPELGGDAERAELLLALAQRAGTRTDRAGDAVLTDADLPYRALERLVWRIAAEARGLLAPAAADVDRVDRLLSDVAKDFLGPRRRRARARIDRVATPLMGTGNSLFTLLLEALVRGEPGLFTALIAARLDLDGAAVSPALTQPERLALFLSAAGLTDGEAATVLIHLSQPLRLNDARLVEIVEGYRSLRADATGELVRRLRLNPHYRRAIVEQQAGRAA